MFTTLFNTWATDSPRPSGTTARSNNGNVRSSGLNERGNFSGEDEHPSAAQVFVVRPENYPSKDVSVPPYFVPPAGLGDRKQNDDVGERLQLAMRRDQHRFTPTPLSISRTALDPSLSHIKPSQPAPDIDFAPAAPRPQSNLSRSPSPSLDDTSLKREVSTCWSSSARKAFEAMIAYPDYVNRYRLAPAKYERIKTFLLDPSTEPLNADGTKDHQTKYQATNWVLRNGKLYRKAEKKGGGLRRHLDVDEAWDVLTAEHVRSGHLGRDRLRKVLERRFIGYTLQEIMFVLKECRRCNGKDKRLRDDALPTQHEAGDALGNTNLTGAQPEASTSKTSTSATTSNPSKQKQASNFMLF